MEKISNYLDNVDGNEKKKCYEIKEIVFVKLLNFANLWPARIVSRFGNLWEVDVFRTHENYLVSKSNIQKFTLEKARNIVKSLKNVNFDLKDAIKEAMMQVYVKYDRRKNFCLGCKMKATKQDSFSCIYCGRIFHHECGMESVIHYLWKKNYSILQNFVCCFCKYEKQTENLETEDSMKDEEKYNQEEDLYPITFVDRIINENDYWDTLGPFKKVFNDWKYSVYMKKKNSNFKKEIKKLSSNRFCAEKDVEEWLTEQEKELNSDLQKNPKILQISPDFYKIKYIGGDPKFLIEIKQEMEIIGGNFDYFGNEKTYFFREKPILESTNKIINYSEKKQPKELPFLLFIRYRIDKNYKVPYDKKERKKNKNYRKEYNIIRKFVKMFEAEKGVHYFLKSEVKTAIERDSFYLQQNPDYNLRIFNQKECSWKDLPEKWKLSTFMKNGELFFETNIINISCEFN